MNRKFWQPSEHLKQTILGILLVAGKPVRFHDLWADCVEDMSKASFINALKYLVEQNLVTRNQQSHKHVEFHVNLQNPIIRNTRSAFQNCVSQWQGLERTYRGAIQLPPSFLAEIRKGGPQKKTIIQAATFAQATFFAMLSVLFVFSEAGCAASPGETLLEQTLLSEMLARLSQIQKKSFTQILRSDRRLASEALGDWLRNQLEILDSFSKSITTAIPLKTNP